MSRLTKLKRGDLVRFRSRELNYFTTAGTINPNPPDRPSSRIYRVQSAQKVQLNDYQGAQIIYLCGSDHMWHNWQFTLYQRSEDNFGTRLWNKSQRSQKKKKNKRTKRIQPAIGILGKRKLDLK